MTDTAKAREYRFTTWDDTTLIITVDEIDPGDMGEPRMLVDYDNGPTTYVSVRDTLAVERAWYEALRDAAQDLVDGYGDNTVDGTRRLGAAYLRLTVLLSEADR